jgi:UDP-3-O-[3-hydroxymyristoyl] glucosamine N-acyltransferase
MMPDTLLNNQMSLRRMQSTLIGLPSPCAIRSDKFPGVWIGSEPVIGNHCLIFGNVFIGNNFRCGDHVLIRDSTAIGDEVTIGNRTFIDAGVAVADCVTIGDEVCIPRFTRIGGQVVISSHVRLLAEPGFQKAIAQRYRDIILEDGCTIGENAVIGPGVCVGSGARVEAGTIVMENVPPVIHRSKAG